MFQKGQPKPTNSGRKKGVKNKNKILKVSDFILESEINIAKELYDAIQKIEDPVQKVKALLDFYKFIDAPVKEKVSEDQDEVAEPVDSVLSTQNILNMTREPKDG